MDGLYRHRQIGWGKRFIPGDRLHHVSGLDAVELRLTDRLVVRVGADEPGAPIAAAEATLARMHDA